MSAPQHEFTKLGFTKSFVLPALWIFLIPALSWMFSSLHTSVGFAVVGAVVGEYLGAAAGLGYLIQQAEGVFDVAGVFAGMFILAVFVVALHFVQASAVTAYSHIVIAADFVKCDHIIGMHYDTMELIRIDHHEAVRKFYAAGKKLHLMKIGETTDF